MTDKLTGIKSLGYIQAVDSAAFHMDRLINLALDSMMMKDIMPTEDNFRETVEAEIIRIAPNDKTKLDNIIRQICETYDVPKWRFHMSLNAELERLSEMQLEREMAKFEELLWKG